MTVYRASVYFVVFFASGIFGWVVDTAHRSAVRGYYESGTLVPFFSIIFGFAALILCPLFRWRKLSFLWSVVLGTILCITLELTSGFILYHFFNSRLWDYTPYPFDFYGFIDVLHSLYWLLLVFLYRLVYKLWIRRRDRAYAPK